LHDSAADWLAQEGIPEKGRSIRWHASLRYVHQGFELTVPWGGDGVSEASVAATVRNFHKLHEQLYTFAQEDTPVEIVTLRVTATGDLPRPALRELPRTGAVEDARVGIQEVDLDEKRHACPVYDRAKLGAGAKLRGPAIVRQLDSTTVLFPDQTAEVDKYGSLIVTTA